MDQELDVVTQDTAEQASQVAGAAGGDTHQVADVADVVEELLIEEISIDGMCGVY